MVSAAIAYVAILVGYSALAMGAYFAFRKIGLI